MFKCHGYRKGVNGSTCKISRQRKILPNNNASANNSDPNNYASTAKKPSDSLIDAWKLGYTGSTVPLTLSVLNFYIPRLKTVKEY